jgi:hypothetical protein
MGQPRQAGFRSRSIRVSIVAGLAVALFSAVARPARAQNDTILGTGAGGGGSDNTAIGVNALSSNESILNTATGENALANDISGCHNTAAGAQTLFNNTSGNYNVAIGFNAGSNLTTGDHNIDIDNVGLPGEAGIIRIGTQGVHAHVVIAGINNTIFPAGSPVLVNSFGRLGIEVSSARFKDNIRDMGRASNKLMKLRPVTFSYKNDPNHTVRYGLVAEEVAQVYPELVIKGQDGKPQSVAYQMLPAMLLNEMQEQVRENRRKDAQLATLEERLGAQQTRINALQQQTAQIGALTARINVLEEEAREARPERVAASTR